jgi:hypothetical protein
MRMMPGISFFAPRRCLPMLFPAAPLQLSARSIASLLAHIFGPAIYDAPIGGIGGGFRGHLVDLVSGPHPDPWRTGPSPDPWRTGPFPEPWQIAIALADAHIQETLTLDRIGATLGGEAAQRAQKRSLRLVAEIDEICPPLATLAETLAAAATAPSVVE